MDEYYQNESGINTSQQFGTLPISYQQIGQSRKHIIYTDGSFKQGKGFIAWYNQTTGDRYYDSASCTDPYRCEYAAVIHALENMTGFADDDEIEIWCDSDPLVKQLNHENGINDDDIRQNALTIWQDVAKMYKGKVKFVWIPRANNKAGKIHGS